MFHSKHLDDLAKTLFATLPTSLQNFENDIQQKFKEVLQAAFARLDLVTREEFDIQTKVLARTREKLDDLQQQIEKLQIKNKTAK
ncbi:ubiquinone biosynthesis accessory factor UbiK [Legionella clemsonensis]|uniref:Ubiquinone biosynthesis accessory factor UbiK n=1 Tax=Legionella clemsonensis TaxID=1867846 RepID=A0A222P093_9GAMM|nr:accessory factor UbiK family protein [Legionella clemsonensis]ASQ45246.1 Membrane fusogenic activity [Legionella clemsonensis]